MKLVLASSSNSLLSPQKSELFAMREAVVPSQALMRATNVKKLLSKKNTAPSSASIDKSETQVSATMRANIELWKSANATRKR